jgi:glutamate--cysteine ligase
LNPSLPSRLELLAQDSNLPLLAQGLRGIERETLRITPDGRLALTPHPPALGSALTHAQITTDYAESLLEFITPAEPDIADALRQLDAIHRFSSSRLGPQMVWSQSMPCVLPDEADIPIGWYGRSHIGLLKHVYRRGLALRYGKTMQCIAGVHYNFSLSERLWQLLQQAESAGGSARDFQSEGYVGLIRNFNRTSWLPMYLFGASPALSTQFLRGRAHQLEQLSEDTLYLPWATSLRMSDLGYQNNAQAGLMPPFNNLMDYMRGMASAVQKPYPAYEKIGLRRDGEWVQISTNILQIENEYYATIRPKRVIRSGERPLEALCSRGVQYVEMRCMDIDPFEPTGIALQTSRFLDIYLHHCALAPSPPTSEDEGSENRGNFARAVKEGRRPGLCLQRQGKAVELRDWGRQLLQQMEPVARLLDRQRGDDQHMAALAAQRERLDKPELTPSARVLQGIEACRGSFQAFGLQQSQAHAASFRARPLSATQVAEFEAMAQASLDEQRRMEESQTGSFDEFITNYRQRTPAQLCQ